jgi:cell division protein FtsL
MTVLTRILDSRFRGFRILEIATFACLVLLVLWVYLAKAAASRERAQIADIESRIGEEQKQVRLLRAEAAHLEQPERIEGLSQTWLGLKPVDPKRDLSPDALPKVAPRESAAATPAPEAAQ